MHIERKIHRRGAATAPMFIAGIWFVGIVLVVFGAIFAANKLGYIGKTPLDTGSNDPQTSVYGSGGSGASCPGIASITETYHPYDRFAQSSIPDSTTGAYFLNGPVGLAGQGAITLAPAKDYDVVVAKNSTTVFASKVQLKAGCISDTFSPIVSQAGAPTLTMTNDNGKTLNAANAQDAVSANGTYTATMTIKAPANKCSSLYGATIVADYAKLYVSGVSTSDATVAATPGYLSHVNPTNATADTFKAFDLSGELCNGAKKDITFTYTTSGTNPQANNANIVFHFLPKNYGVDTKTNTVIGPAVEDCTSSNSCSAITIGNTTIEHFTT